MPTSELLQKLLSVYGNDTQSIRDALNGLKENEFKSGGKIHIKPENRGKFTALKKRTGHSATWFKLHGTPAQRKMATFALNARKWKHEDGGPLDLTYYGGMLPDVNITETLPSIWTDEGEALAKKMAGNVAQGNMLLSNVPRDYYNYVEGEVRGAYPIRQTGKEAAKVIGLNAAGLMGGYGLQAVGALSPIVNGAANGVQKWFEAAMPSSAPKFLAKTFPNTFKMTPTVETLGKAADTGILAYWGNQGVNAGIDTWNNAETPVEKATGVAEIGLGSLGYLGYGAGVLSELSNARNKAAMLRNATEMYRANTPEVRSFEPELPFGVQIEAPHENVNSSIADIVAGNFTIPEQYLTLRQQLARNMMGRLGIANDVYADGRSAEEVAEFERWLDDLGFMRHSNNASRYFDTDTGQSFSDREMWDLFNRTRFRERRENPIRNVERDNLMQNVAEISDDNLLQPISRVPQSSGIQETAIQDLIGRSFNSDSEILDALYEAYPEARERIGNVINGDYNKIREIMRVLGQNGYPLQMEGYKIGKKPIESFTRLIDEVYPYSLDNPIAEELFKSKLGKSYIEDLSKLNTEDLMKLYISRLRNIEPTDTGPVYSRAIRYEQSEEAKAIANEFGKRIGFDLSKEPEEFYDELVKYLRTEQNSPYSNYQFPFPGDVNHMYWVVNDVSPGSYRTISSPDEVRKITSGIVSTMPPNTALAEINLSPDSWNWKMLNTLRNYGTERGRATIQVLRDRNGNPRIGRRNQMQKSRVTRESVIKDFEKQFGKDGDEYKEFVDYINNNNSTSQNSRKYSDFIGERIKAMTQKEIDKQNGLIKLAREITGDENLPYATTQEHYDPDYAIDYLRENGSYAPELRSFDFYSIMHKAGGPIGKVINDNKADVLIDAIRRVKSNLRH